MEEIIEIFERWRKSEKLTQRDAAEVIGISAGSYNNFIKNRKIGKIVKRQLLSYFNLNPNLNSNKIKEEAWNE